jgi:hypothetical protein
MQSSGKLVYGVGTNDADYVVEPLINGKRDRCPVYRAWKDMLKRCYSSKCHARQPAYSGCSVAPEWLNFMVFRSWMLKQEWQGMHLDKDMLLPGNKIYGPDACVLITAKLNTFTIDCGAARGQWPTGVDFRKGSAKFRASCRNPFTGKRQHLGYFDCPNEANEAWRKRKHEHALALSAQQTDPRIAKALSTRYLKEGEAQ